MSPRYFWRFLALAILCAVLASIFFVPGLGGGFLLDDKPNIVQNVSIHLASQPGIDDLLYAAYSFQPGGSSRPLSMLSFSLDFWRAGLDPFAFRVTNLVIHGLTTLVLALFYRQLLVLAGWSGRQHLAVALLLALLWALHPLQVSSVLYIVQRMQTLGTLFLVLALLCYLHMRAAQMEGRRSRLFAVLVLLFWALGFASKEDSAMLPAYTLVLELTVLRFRSARPATGILLRRAYTVLVLLGVLVYFMIVVPHYWNWQAYPGRDFSTLERLLTQGRVLVTYLWQIILPLPGSMPFFYDDLEVSRSLLQPVTTLPALALIAGLLAWAWLWRQRRPLFACGVLLFFAGHFVTSNVINLELAFEHRNHFPLIGAVLALGDLFVAAIRFLKLNGRRMAALAGVLVAISGASTAVRAHAWGDNLRLAQYLLDIAPGSARAWGFLCIEYFERSKENPGNLDMAIDTCQKGAEKLPDSAILANNVVIFKTQAGTVAQKDWDDLLLRLQRARMSAQNKNLLWVTLDNAERDKYDNEQAVLRVIEIITSKTTLSFDEYLRVAAYIFNKTDEPVKAFAYLQRAVELAPAGDPAIEKMLHELPGAGVQDWADRLMPIWDARKKEAP